VWTLLLSIEKQAELQKFTFKKNVVFFERFWGSIFISNAQIYSQMRKILRTKTYPALFILGTALVFSYLLWACFLEEAKTTI